MNKKYLKKEKNKNMKCRITITAEINKRLDSINNSKLK